MDAGQAVTQDQDRSTGCPCCRCIRCDSLRWSPADDRTACPILHPDTGERSQRVPVRVSYPEMPVPRSLGRISCVQESCADGSGSGSPSCAYPANRTPLPVGSGVQSSSSMVLFTMRLFKVLTEMPSAAAASALLRSLLIVPFVKKITSRARRIQPCRYSSGPQRGLCSASR